MKKKKISFLLSIVVLLLINCKKDDSAERVIVSGKAFDEILQKPVKNLSVYVYDNVCENFACHFNQIVDSTRTDDNGYYHLNFKPKNLNSLHLVCNFPKGMYGRSRNQNTDFEYQLTKGNYTGKDFILDKTSVLKTRVILTNNPFPPLKIFDNIDGHIEQVYGMNKDTTVLLRTVCNVYHQIDFIAFSPDMSYYRRRTDNIPPSNYADTIYITIQADPNNFPIKKYN